MNDREFCVLFSKGRQAGCWNHIQVRGGSVQRGIWQRPRKNTTRHQYSELYHIWQKG